MHKNTKIDTKKQVLCDLQVLFLCFNCQTPGGAVGTIVGIMIAF